MSNIEAVKLPGSYICRFCRYSFENAGDQETVTHKSLCVTVSVYLFLSESMAGDDLMSAVQPLASLDKVFVMARANPAVGSFEKYKSALDELQTDDQVRAWICFQVLGGADKDFLRDWYRQAYLSPWSVEGPCDRYAWEALVARTSRDHALAFCRSVVKARLDALTLSESPLVRRL